MRYAGKPGFAPAGDLLFFARQRNLRKRKATRWSGSPALRYGATCGARRKRGRARTRLRLRQSLALIRFRLRSSAGPTGDRGIRVRGGDDALARHRRSPTASPTVGPSPTPSGCAEERSEKWTRASDCLSAASSSPPRLDRAPQVAPEQSGGDADSGVAFSLLTFFWRRKRK
jgi:hypothetical protein